MDNGDQPTGRADAPDNPWPMVNEYDNINIGAQAMFDVTVSSGTFTVRVAMNHVPLPSHRKRA